MFQCTRGCKATDARKSRLSFSFNFERMSGATINDLPPELLDLVCISHTKQFEAHHTRVQILGQVVATAAKLAEVLPLRIVCRSWATQLSAQLYSTIQLTVEAAKDEGTGKSASLLNWKGGRYLQLNPVTNFSSYKIPTRKPWSSKDKDIKTTYLFPFLSNLTHFKPAGL